MSLKDSENGALRLSADFKSESIQQVLELLRITSDIDYQYIDNKVSFSRLKH